MSAAHSASTSRGYWCGYFGYEDTTLGLEVLYGRWILYIVYVHICQISSTLAPTIHKIIDDVGGPQYLPLQRGSTTYTQNWVRYLHWFPHLRFMYVHILVRLLWPYVLEELGGVLERCLIFASQNRAGSLSPRFCTIQERNLKATQV